MNFAALGVVVSCASARGQGALSIDLGLSRDQAVAALEASDYCRPAGPPEPIENYARCDSPGLQLGESWVVARYNKDGKLARVTRYERQPDERHATERFESLVKAARREYGPESKQARTRLAEIAEPPDGTVTWLAWFSQDAAAITALYLVRPPSEREPNVVEEIRWALKTE